MSFLRAFHADFNDVILKMIPWPKLEGSHPVLGHHGPSLSACFGSNERGFEPFDAAERGGKAWPTVPYEWLSTNFGHGIILRITWLKSA